MNRVVLLGLSGSGKTSLLTLMTHGDISYVEPTIGVNVKILEIGGRRMEFWDIGGRTDLKLYWTKYLEKADCLFYVIDGSDKDRIAENVLEFQRILRFLNQTQIPILVIVNKKDKNDVIMCSQIVEMFRLYKISDRQWHIIFSSAFGRIGLKDMFSWLIDIGNQIKH